jgi:hypothetical protein
MPDSPPGFLESWRGNPPDRDFHTYTWGQGVAGAATLVHTPEVDQSENPDPPHWARQPVSLRAGVTTAGLPLFSQSDSDPTRGVIARNREVRLCPIHTMRCVKPDRAVHCRLTDLSRGPPQRVCRHSADTADLGKVGKFKKRPILLVSAEGLEPSTP